MVARSAATKLELAWVVLMGSWLQDRPGDDAHPLVWWRVDSGTACKFPHAGASSGSRRLAEMPIFQDQCLPRGVQALELEVVFVLFEQAPGLHWLV